MGKVTEKMGETKQCPNCGIELNNTAKYCGDCGFRFPNIMDVQPEPAKPAAAAGKPDSSATGSARKKSRRSSSKQPVGTGMQRSASKHRIGLFLFLTVFSVAVIGGFVFLLDAFYQTALAAEEEEAERGRRDGEEEEPDEDEEDDDVPKAAPLLGTSLKTENGQYYFAREGDVYFFISKQTENYIRGNITVRDMTKEDIEASEAAGLETAVRNAQFYRVDAVVTQELYYGSKRSGNTYTMYVATNGETAAIYDSGWADMYAAEVGTLAPRGDLESHFTKDPETMVSVVTTDTGVVAGTNFAVEDIHFGSADAVSDNNYILEVSGSGGSYYLFKSGGFFESVLYASENAGDVNNASEFLTAPEGSFIGTYAQVGNDLYYTIGHETENDYVIDALYCVGLDGGTPELILEGAVEDFCVSDDALYYTDYSKIVRIDRQTLQADTIWNYGVYCFELYDDIIFVYDGEAWEIIDAVNGDEYGYVIERINYAYESDVVQVENNMIFHVAYDYSTGQVALHAIDIEHGREYQVGEAFDGTPSDTYNVFFEGKYAYFTVDDMEGIARVDVTNGDSQMISFSDYGYYYANEICRLNGAMVLHAYDEQRNECLLQMDSNMNLTVFR